MVKNKGMSLTAVTVSYLVAFFLVRFCFRCRRRRRRLSSRCIDRVVDFFSSSIAVVSSRRRLEKLSPSRV